MEEKYKSKYAIPQSRLAGWDYGSNALYFVTICTQSRLSCFGEMQTGDESLLKITDIGQIALNHWLSIPHFHSYVELDEFIIMPDHLHGILFINKPEKQNWDVNKFGPQKANLASIIRGFKSSVTRDAIKNNISFEWQPRYYDRVVRNEKELLNIRNYIVNNPFNWTANEDFENLNI
jgi:REP element-mobilizing transposase RayT